MTTTNLIINFPTSGNSYVLKFNRDITVYDLCQEIHSKIKEASHLDPSEYGIFVPDPDPKHSFWLDNSRMFSYYHFCDNFEVQYAWKLRLLVIQTMDGTRKTLQVDDSKTVAELMFTICSKMGITNYEEYSLIRPFDEEEKMRTLTLRKAKSIAKDQNKLEKMKQRLHTDDELNWLAHGKTLRQLGVEESDVLLLRRKYFFSDQNVDTRDPVQLNLLFVQLKEAILNGTHPISQDQAVDLAALQCQAEMGKMVSEKIKNNPIDLKNCLPKEYMKAKGIERRILERYKNLGNFGERDAKLRYVQLCRSLPTYGITFFLIKEKLKGRNKLVPRLFGVSKESVMRVDERTKEILETWPLTRIRRWAATANLFTLDFGQYSPDGNYVMQTTEGEQIAQLIAGYVDIILRRQRTQDSSLNLVDEENTIVEENISPSKANVISSVSGTLLSGQHGQETNLSHSGLLRTASQRENVTEGHIATEGHTVIQTNLGGATIGSGFIINSNGNVIDTKATDGRGFQMIDLGQPKRALLSRLDYGMKTIQEATEDLSKPIYEDDEALRGDDTITKRWRIETLEQARTGVLGHLGAMTMATGRLISGLQGADNREDSITDLDFADMDASMASIGLNVHGLMHCVRMYDQINAAHVEPPNMELKGAAQNLSNAFLELIQATFPSVNANDKVSSLSRSTSSLVESKGGPDRAALLEAASHVGDASRELLQLISQIPHKGQNLNGTADGNEIKTYENQAIPFIDWEARDRLLTVTKSVANSMAGLVKKAKLSAMALDKEASQFNSMDTLSDSQINLLRKTQTNLVQSATRAGKHASQLVTCAKVAVCTMEQPESQQQLRNTTKEVIKAADAVPEATSELINSYEWPPDLHEGHLRIVEELQQGVIVVHQELDRFRDCLVTNSINSHQDPVVLNLLSVSHQLPASVGDGLNLVNKANALASAAASLMADLRGEASKSTSRIGISPTEAMERANLLEEEIRNLLVTARECAQGNVQSLRHQQKIISAAEQLMNTAHSLAGPLIRTRLTKGLEFATRQTASNVNPLLTVGDEVIRICQGDTRQLASNLEHLHKRVMPQVNMSCNEARNQPYNEDKQTNLLDASSNLMKCLEDLLRSADAVAPTIPDYGVQSAFTGVARNTQDCLIDLRLCYANSEALLNSQSVQTTLGTGQENCENPEESNSQIAELQTEALNRNSERLDKLESDLHQNLFCLLPGETLDSVCSALWSSVDEFKHEFQTDSDDLVSVDESNSPDNQTWTKVPKLVEQILACNEEQSSRKLFEIRQGIVNSLVDHISSVIHGIRGLASIFNMITNTVDVDSNLVRVLKVAHGTASKRHSSVSGCSSMLDQSTFNSPEQQFQLTAEAMQHNLISLGDTCLLTTSQLINWVLRKDLEPITNENEINEAAMIAEQLNTSINAILGYIPGEVTVRRLFALLNDASKIVDVSRMETSAEETNIIRRTPIVPIIPSIDSPPSAPTRRTLNHLSSDVYENLSDAARHLAKVCLGVSHDLSNNLKPPNPSVDFNPVKSPSNLILLACVTDRLTSALADLVRAAGCRSAQMRTIGHLLIDFNQTAEPVAQNLYYTMRTLDSHGIIVSDKSKDNLVKITVPDLPLLKTILMLRDWALELDQKITLKDQSLSLIESSTSNNITVQQSTTTYPIKFNDWGSDEEIIAHMRNQCEISLKRINSLLHPNLYDEDNEMRLTKDTFCPILMPINNHNYVQCCDILSALDQEFMVNLNDLLRATIERNPSPFINSLTSLIHTTNQLVQITYQAAYLIGAAHPSSKPAHVNYFIGTTGQLISIHDHITVIRKGASEINNAGSELGSSPDLQAVDFDHVLHIAGHIAQRATQLCQSTRPYLTDVKVSSDRKLLAESLESVARSAASIFKLIKTCQNSYPERINFEAFDKLSDATSQLGEHVDHYAEILFRDTTEAPAQLADEAVELQSPVLACGQTIIRASARAIDCANILLHMNADEESEQAKQPFLVNRQTMHDACMNLLNLLQLFVPGLNACDTIQKTIKDLYAYLDNAIMSNNTRKSFNSSNNLENSLGLIRTSVEQLQQKCLDALENWKRGNWEIMAHNFYAILTYLPHFVKECIRSASNLNCSSDQTNLYNLSKTVLETVEQFVGAISSTLREQVQSIPVSFSFENLAKLNHQMNQACMELLEQISLIAKEQGGLNWQISLINSACSKLDSIRPTSSSFLHTGSSESSVGINLPTEFVQLHSRLGHQSHALIESANQVIQASANPNANLTAVQQFVQHFIQITDTVQNMSLVLKNHAQLETGFTLSQKLCHVTKTVGAACSEFLHAPLSTENFANLDNRLADLKAVLQSCARGADACATAITGINQLVADLDTAALFARAGTLYDISKLTESPNLPTSPNVLMAKHRAFQCAQERVMQAAKCIVKDMRTLIKSTSTDQDALAVSAQNCLLKATELTESAKHAASCASSIPHTSILHPDMVIEAQVQLLTMTRDVASGLVRLLNHGKQVSSTCYAIESWGEQSYHDLSTMLSLKQKALNDTAVQVVEIIASLSKALRSLGDTVSLAKTPSSPPGIASLPTPKKSSLSSPNFKSPTSFSPQNPPVAEATDANKLTVHASMESYISVVRKLEDCLSSWEIKDGFLNCSVCPDLEDDLESEKLVALGQSVNPSYLITAARDITQAAIKANSATTSGRPSEVALAGDMVRRAAEELVHRLKPVLQTALGTLKLSSNQFGRMFHQNGRNEDEHSTTDEELEISHSVVEQACKRGVTGTLSTLSELRQLLEHMNKALDTGPGSPSTVQVTLAMRRLRETVFEIVESAMLLPGAKEDVSDFGPHVSPKPFPVVYERKFNLNPNHVDRNSKLDEQSSVHLPNGKRQPSILLTTPMSQWEIEKSIAAANATARNAGTVGVQTVLQNLVSDIERDIQRISQLHSTHSFKDHGSQMASSTSSSFPSVNVDLSADDDLEALAASGNMDAILIACRHVVHTTLGLMHWAAAAQRELMQQGRLKPVDLTQPVSENETESQWSQGLVSAARYVAAAASHLVESAQTLVAMHTTSGPQQTDLSVSSLSLKPEGLISAAQTTAACTAHLVLACIAKADPSSVSCMGLRGAGASVKRATERLVQLIHSATHSSVTPITSLSTEGSEGSAASLDHLGGGVVSSMRQVIETKSSIAAKQKELEHLHNQLKHIHQDQYKTSHHNQ